MKQGRPWTNAPTSTIRSPDTVNDQPNTDDTPDANDAAQAALERLAALSIEPNDLFDRGVLARVDADGWGLEPDASPQSRPDADATPAADEEERARDELRE